MSNYSVAARRQRWPKVLAGVLVIFAVLTIIAVVAVRREYNENLKPVSTVSMKSVEVTVAQGLSVREISQMLEEKGLIRKSWALEWYVNSKNAREKLQAGTYELNPGQGVPEIVSVMTQGRVATDLVTILPGQRLDQIRKALVDHGMEESAVNQALDHTRYKDHPALVDKPAGASLEGYLYPESFQKTAETRPEEIIRKSLDEMQKHLTPELRAAIVKQGLTVYEGITLASIIEQEVARPSDKSLVAQVFLRRLRQDMPLQSDPTAPYGAILDNKPPSLTYDSAYNTYKRKGLPPTPISNFNISSLQAVANPTPNDWLYFVAGDDGNTYFSRTLAEHEELTRKHCTKLCNSPL